MSEETDYRHHTFLVKCESCPRWHRIFEQAPLRADLWALKHARRKRGHRTIVWNMTTLATFTTHLIQPDPVLDDVAPF